MSNDDATEKLPDDKQAAEKKELQPVDPMEGLFYDVHRLFEQMKSLNDKVDARLHDTRPLWEGVQSRLQSIENQLGEISGKLERLEPDVKEIKRNQRALNDNFLSLQGRQSETEERIDNLEKRVS